MGNCYLEFYFEVPLPSDEVKAEVGKFLGRADDYFGAGHREREKICEELAPVFSEFAEYEELGFTWNFRQNILAVTGEESGNTEHAIDLLKWLLPKLDIKKAGFTYAMWGDGDYDGGAIVVSMTDNGPEVEYIHASYWLMEKLSTSENFDEVPCALCGEMVPAKTAHLHEGEYIGDECCWDERLRTTE